MPFTATCTSNEVQDVNLQLTDLELFCKHCITRDGSDITGDGWEDVAWNHKALKGSMYLKPPPDPEAEMPAVIRYLNSKHVRAPGQWETGLICEILV